MRMRKRVGVTVLFLAVTAATVVVLSPGETKDSNALSMGSSDVATVGTDAMRVFLNPETGEVTSGLEPTDAVLELSPELENALSQSSEGLAAVHNADGSITLDLQGRFQSATVARVGKDGKVIVCTDDVTHAEQSLSEPTSGTVTREVK